MNIIANSDLSPNRLFGTYRAHKRSTIDTAHILPVPPAYIRITNNIYTYVYNMCFGFCLRIDQSRSSSVFCCRSWLSLYTSVSMSLRTWPSSTRISIIASYLVRASICYCLYTHIQDIIHAEKICGDGAVRRSAFTHDPPLSPRSLDNKANLATEFGLGPHRRYHTFFVCIVNCLMRVPSWFERVRYVCVLVVSGLVWRLSVFCACWVCHIHWWKEK